MTAQNLSIAALTIGVAVTSASLIAVVSVVPPSPDVQVREVQLTGGDAADSPLGDGTALVYGGSGMPIPPPQYVDAADTLYLQPLGFTGTAQSSFLPNGLYPLTGVKSLGLDTSLGQDQPIMISDIESRIAAGGVSPENPAVVFGYSQSSGAASLIMQQLHDAGVPSDDVHFVLVGDTQIPTAAFSTRSTFQPVTPRPSPLLTIPSNLRHHLICTRPTSIPSNTTVPPTSRTTRPTCCRT